MSKHTRKPARKPMATFAPAPPDAVDIEGLGLQPVDPNKPDGPWVWIADVRQRDVAGNPIRLYGNGRVRLSGELPERLRNRIRELVADVVAAKAAEEVSK